MTLAEGEGVKKREAEGGGAERPRKEPNLKALRVCSSRRPIVNPSAALVLRTLQGE